MGAIFYNGSLYGGGGSTPSANERELTYAEYQALSEEEKNNGTTYYVTDVDNEGNITGYTAGDGITITEEKVISAIGRKTEVGTEYTIPETVFTDYEGNSQTRPEMTVTEALGSETFNVLGDNTAVGQSNHAEGKSNIAVGTYCHVEGSNNYAETTCSHAEGYGNKTYGPYSHVEGSSNKVMAQCGHAEGLGTTAFGSYSHAEGNSTIANGADSHAEGSNTIAGTNHAHAEGYGSKAVSTATHAEGRNTQALAYAAHAEGIEAIAEGYSSHAEGYLSHAKKPYTHAEGYNTIAAGEYSHVQGKYNIEDDTVTDDNPQGTYAHIVGNGSYDSSTQTTTRSNAHTLDWEGNAWFAGTIKGKDFDSESISNPNLLINPNFKINQRGKTEVTAAGYTADCWYLRAASGYKVTVEDGGLRIANTVGETTIGTVVWQVIPLSEMNLRGCTLTVSAKISEVVGTTGLRFITDGTAPAGLQITKDGIYTVTYTIGEYTNNVGVGLVSASADCSALFEWVKIELGSVATPFVPPDPATELAKCQRYYASQFVVKNGFYGTAYADRANCARLTVALPATIRNLPTIVYTADNLALFDGVNIIGITALQVHTMMGNEITLSVIAEGLTIGKSYLLLAIDNTTIAYSAEL